MNKIIAYMKDSYNELVHKVSWPTKEELTSSTMIVVVASIILAMAVFVMDWIFQVIVDFLYGI